MSVPRTFLAAAALLSSITLGLGGTDPFARLALAAGLPGLAAGLADDPGWRAVALYRAGRYDEAAALLPGNDPQSAYNRGTALARAGDYAAALEAFDIVLAQVPDHPAARANFDLIAGFYARTLIDAESAIRWSRERDGGPVVEADTGKGKGRASGQGEDSTNSGGDIGLPELNTIGAERVRKGFDARQIAATERWLATLTDVPGAYLAARIYEERKRRAALGLLQPEPEDPW